MPSPDQQLVIFACPSCGLQCEADTVKNTLRHQVPPCAFYTRSDKVDFVEASGVGARRLGRACSGCKGSGSVTRVVNKTISVTTPCLRCKGTGSEGPACAAERS